MAWMTIDEVADKAAVSRRTVERAKANHFLPTKLEGDKPLLWYSPEGHLPKDEDSQTTIQTLQTLQNELQEKNELLKMNAESTNQQNEIQMRNQEIVAQLVSVLTQEAKKNMIQRAFSKVEVPKINLEGSTQLLQSSGG